MHICSCISINHLHQGSIRKLLKQATQWCASVRFTLNLLRIGIALDRGSSAVCGRTAITTTLITNKPQSWSFAWLLGSSCWCANYITAVGWRAWQHIQLGPCIQQCRSQCLKTAQANWRYGWSLLIEHGIRLLLPERGHFPLHVMVISLSKTVNKRVLTKLNHYGPLSQVVIILSGTVGNLFRAPKIVK